VYNTATKKNLGSGSVALKSKGNHAEQQALQAACEKIQEALVAQGSTDTLSLSLIVDTQVCDECCLWMDTNLISWLKKIKVGSGSKAKDWAGTFSLAITANGGTKTISGTSSTVAGLGGSNWGPVGEGYKYGKGAKAK
jgi:hypothetical protein